MSWFGRWFSSQAPPELTVPRHIYDSEVLRSGAREASLLAEIRHLTDSLTALGDVRAQRSVAQAESLAARAATAANKPPTDPADKPRPSVRMPPYINSLSGGGHVNMSLVRNEVEMTRLVKGRHQELGIGRAATAADRPDTPDLIPLIPPNEVK